MARALHILSGGAAQGLVARLQFAFEAKHGCALAGTFGAVGAMKEALLGGAPCDVMVVTEAMVDALEEVIDRYMERVDLPPKFVIPGGSELSARLDLACTAIRRAERRVVALKLAGELEDDTVLRFLNRASDFLFATARYADEPEPALFEGRG
jgi:cob(I)alamin adenosyltransferase